MGRKEERNKMIIVREERKERKIMIKSKRGQSKRGQTERH